MQEVRFQISLDRSVDFEDADLRTKGIFISNMLGRRCDEEM